MKNDTISFEELALSNTYQLEAIVRVLEKKGLVSKQEILDELQQLKREEEERKKKSGD